MSNVMEALLKPLQRHYGKPKTDNVEAFLDDYVRLLGSYEEKTLRHAADHLLKTHKIKSWPTIGECQAAIKSSIPSATPFASHVSTYDPDLDPCSIKRESEAKKLIKSELGRQAASEDWISNLYSFCKRERRLPTISEQRKLRIEARSTRANYNKLKTEGKPGPLTAACLNAYECMFKEKERLAAIANGQTDIEDVMG